MGSAMPGADPVQEVVHCMVFEPVADLPAGSRRADPALLSEHAKCLGHRDYPKESFTKAVGIGCDNIDEYYDPNSVF